MGGRTRNILAWTAATGWAAVIFRFSAMPGSAVPGRFGSLAHFIEYAVLGALLLLALRVRRPLGGAVVLAIAIASAYGVTDELHQSFVVLRMPDPIDWLVDTTGATSAALGLAAVLAIRGRSPQ